MRRAALSTAVILSLMPLCAAEHGSVLLRGAVVHTISGPDIPNGSVLIKDGRIVEVGEHVVVARGVRTVELKGLHIYPGMIDSATQVGLSEIGAVREMNDTSDLGLFKPQLRAATAVNPASEHIPVTRANGITSVVTIPEGGIIAGQAVLFHLNGWTMEDMAVREPVAMRMEFPYIRSAGPVSFDGSRKTDYPEAKKKYQEEIRQLNDFMESAQRYRQAKTADGSGLEADLKLAAMLPVLAGKIPLLVHVEKAKTIHEAIAFGEKYKVKIILEEATEAWKMAAELKAHNIPVILPPTLRLPDQEDDPYDKPFSIPGELAKAGVKFAFASFGPGPGDNPRNLPYQAAAAVAFGLPQAQALKAVMLDAAEIWGAGDELGSIDKGKWADLIVTDGDPLEIRTQIKQVFIQGVAVDLETKHRRLYEKYLSRQ